MEFFTLKTVPGESLYASPSVVKSLKKATKQISLWHVPDHVPPLLLPCPKPMLWKVSRSTMQFPFWKPCRIDNHKKSGAWCWHWQCSSPWKCSHHHDTNHQQQRALCWAEMGIGWFESPSDKCSPRSSPSVHWELVSQGLDTFWNLLQARPNKIPLKTTKNAMMDLEITPLTLGKLFWYLGLWFFMSTVSAEISTDSYWKAYNQQDNSCPHNFKKYMFWHTSKSSHENYALQTERSQPLLIVSGRSARWFKNWSRTWWLYFHAPRSCVLMKTGPSEQAIGHALVGYSF